MTDTWNKGIINDSNSRLMFVSTPTRTNGHFVPANTTTHFDCIIPRPGDNRQDFPRDHISVVTDTGKLVGYVWQKSKTIWSHTKPEIDETSATKIREKEGGEVALKVTSDYKLEMKEWPLPTSS